MATARVRMVNSFSPGDEYGADATCIVGDCFEGTNAARLVGAGVGVGVIFFGAPCCFELWEQEVKRTVSRARQVSQNGARERLKVERT